MSPIRNTASALWGCSGFWGWAVTTPLGAGCTNFDEPWSAQVGTDFLARSRWTKFSLAGSVREREAAERVEKLWWSLQHNTPKEASAESVWPGWPMRLARAWSPPCSKWLNLALKCIRTAGGAIIDFLH